MVYTIVFSILLFIYLLSKSVQFKQDTRRLTFVCFLILAALSAVRFQNESSDFARNYMHMIRVRSMNWKEVFQYSDEWLHVVLRKLISLVTADPQWYFVITAVFIVGVFVYAGWKNAEDPILYCILYFAVFAYFSQNNITRQAIAAAISIFSWDAIRKRKPFKFGILILIGFLIHRSIIFMVPLYFVSKMKFNRKLLLAYTAICGLVVVFSRQIMAIGQRFLYSDYDEESYGMVASNPLRLALVALVLIMLFGVKWGEKRQNEDQMAIKKYVSQSNLVLHGAFFYVMFMLLSTFRILLFARIAMYFTPFASLAIDAGMAQISPKHRRVAILVLLLFICAWFTLMNYYGKYIPTPYATFWQFPNRLLGK